MTDQPYQVCTRDDYPYTDAGDERVYMSECEYCPHEREGCKYANTDECPHWHIDHDLPAGAIESLSRTVHTDPAQYAALCDMYEREVCGIDAPDDVWLTSDNARAFAKRVIEIMESA